MGARGVWIAGEREPADDPVAVDGDEHRRVGVAAHRLQVAALVRDADATSRSSSSQSPGSPPTAAASATSSDASVGSAGRIAIIGRPRRARRVADPRLLRGSPSGRRSTAETPPKNRFRFGPTPDFEPLVGERGVRRRRTNRPRRESSRRRRASVVGRSPRRPEAGAQRPPRPPAGSPPQGGPTRHSRPRGAALPRFRGRPSASSCSGAGRRPPARSTPMTSSSPSMLFSWKPWRKTPDPEPSVDESPTAAPSASTTETWVVPVGRAPAPAPSVPYAAASAAASARASSERPGRASVAGVQRRQPGLHDDATERRRRGRHHRSSREDADEWSPLFDAIGVEIGGERPGGARRAPRHGRRAGAAAPERCPWRRSNRRFRTRAVPRPHAGGSESRISWRNAWAPLAANGRSASSRAGTKSVAQGSLPRRSCASSSPGATPARRRMPHRRGRPGSTRRRSRSRPRPSPRSDPTGRRRSSPGRWHHGRARGAGETRRPRGP